LIPAEQIILPRDRDRLHRSRECELAPMRFNPAIVALVT
jgi:hypothetical protein